MLTMDSGYHQGENDAHFLENAVNILFLMFPFCFVLALCMEETEGQRHSLEKSAGDT